MDNPIDPTSDAAKTYEMLWDCKFCGTKKLLGKTHRFCPNCGGQQDPSWRYFPADNEKVAVENHIYVGADLICKACQGLNGAKSEYCGTCGSPLSDSAHAMQGASRVKDEWQSFVAEDLHRRQFAEHAAQITTLKSATNTGASSSTIKYIALGMLVVIGLIVFAITRTQSITVRTDGYKWQRTIGIDMMQPVSGNAECGHQPADAYNIVQHYEQVGSRQVADGEVCQTTQINQGDGTFREQQQCHTRYRTEAVMGNMCRYAINRWVAINPALASGDKSTTPYWPTTNVNQSAACLALGCRRETQRNENYVLSLSSDKGHNYQCSVARELWDKTEVGASFNMKIGSLLNTAKCDTLNAL